MGIMDNVAQIEATLRGMKAAAARELYDANVTKFGPPEEWHLGEGCFIAHDDALDWLPNQEPGPDIVFADPPFNIGQDYGGHDDQQDEEVFRAFLRLLLLEMAGISGKRTTVFLNVPEELLHPTLDYARDAGLGLTKHIARAYNFGQNKRDDWVTGFCNLLCFRRPGARGVFTPRQILQPSVRWHMKDKRIAKSPTKGWAIPNTCWEFPVVQGNNRERVPGRPNQLPLDMLARVVLAHSRKGRRVVEACMGTGGLGLVARQLGREYHGCDIDRSSFDIVQDRLQDSEQREIAENAIKRVRAPHRLPLPPGRDWTAIIKENQTNG